MLKILGEDYSGEGWLHRIAKSPGWKTASTSASHFFFSLLEEKKKPSCLTILDFQMLSARLLFFTSLDQLVTETQRTRAYCLVSSKVLKGKGKSNARFMRYSLPFLSGLLWPIFPIVFHSINKAAYFKSHLM